MGSVLALQVNFWDCSSPVDEIEIFLSPAGEISVCLSPIDEIEIFLSPPDKIWGLSNPDKSIFGPDLVSSRSQPYCGIGLSLTCMAYTDPKVDV